MNCLSCGGPLEYAGGGAYARCTHCLALFQNQGGRLVPMQVQAPGGGYNPDFNNAYAQQLGFAPRQASHQQFQVGGMGVKVNTAGLDRAIQNKISGLIWSLIIGAVVLLIVAGVGLYIFIKTKNAVDNTMKQADDAMRASTTTKTVKWDGKSTFSCSMNDLVKLEGVTANIASGTAIDAGGNCTLELANCNITAPIGITAGMNAKVTITGGSVKGTQKAIVADMNSVVTVAGGAKIDGKTEKSMNGKIVGM